MTWIFWVLGSHVFWAGENILTKYAVDKRIKNPYIFLILFTLLEGVIFLIWPFINFTLPSWSIIGWLMLASFLYFFGGFPYIKAMQMEEVTRINILWGLIPVISLFFGYLIGDQITGQQGLALLILVVGTILAGVHLGLGKWRFSKAFWLMLLACVSFAAYGVIMRFVFRNIPFINGFIFVLFFEFFYSLLVLFFSKKWLREFKEVVHGIDVKFVVILFLTVLTALGGSFMNQMALSLQQTSLVFSLEGFQIIFVFIVTILLSSFFPHIIKEEFDKKNLLLKLIALILMVVGIVVLNIK